MTDNREYPARPIVGVGVAVFRGDDILLIQRGKPPRLGQWSLPGGAQEIGETVHETAIREIQEEAGIEIDGVKLVDVIDTIRRDEDGRVQFHYTLIDMVAEWRAGELRAGSDAMGARWFTLAEVDALGLWSETVRIIREGDQLRRTDVP